MAVLFTKSVTTRAWGSSVGWSENAYTFTLTVTENSYNIANNTSNVTINFTCNAGYWHYTQYWSLYSQIFLDGDSVDYDAWTSMSTGNHTLSSWTGDVPHNPDGKRTITVKAYFRGVGYYEYDPVPRTTTIESGNLSLTTIPRKSFITIDPSSITSTDTALTISLTKSSSSFADTIQYCYKRSGEYNWSDWVTIRDRSVGEYNFSIPSTTINSIFNNVSGELKVRSTTYTSASAASPIAEGSDGYDEKIAMVKRGIMPLVLYHNLQNGTVGASLLGGQVNAPGFYVEGIGPFTVQELTINGTKYKVLAKRV